MSHLCPRCAHKYRDCRCGSPDNRDMPCGACDKTHEPRPCPLPDEPKPAPVVPAHPYGCAHCYGFGFVWDGTVQVPCVVCRDAKPAPAVAAEDAHAWKQAGKRATPPTNGPRIHALKTVDPHFDDITEGRKTFEMRRDDRGFAVGDVLDLRQYDAKIDEYSGYTTQVTVTHILRGPAFGLAEGWVCMSIERPGGAHEAAVEAARREERERIVRGVIAAFAKYDRECWARIDGSARSTGAITGCRNRFMAVVTGDEEAAKGQAK